MAAGSYHHGSLRAVLLDAAVDAIGEKGAVALSMRNLARRAGVSHAASTHHFGDKAGLLTALAIQGHALFADALSATLEQTNDFLEVGVTYVRTAVEHPSHFEVMFRPELYRADDPTLVAAEMRTAAVLHEGLALLPEAKTGADLATAAIAAWSIVHGFATLWISGQLRGDVDDAAAGARAVASLLFRDPPT